MQELNENGTAFADNSEPIRILKNDRCFADIKIIKNSSFFNYRLSENMIVEGPWMMFKEGNYFLFYSSSWVTMSSYKVEVALSSNITHQVFMQTIFYPGGKVRTLCRQNESNLAYFWQALTSIFGLCFMSVSQIKSNCYSLIQGVQVKVK